MALWKYHVSIEKLKNLTKNTLVDHLGIEYIEIGEDFIKAKMPVDNRTKQPYGILHGGASVALAESLGGAASYLSVDDTKKRCAGLEINANHVRSVSGGFVYGVIKPVTVGKTIQVWEIRISNEKGKLVCISRITISILDKK